MFNCPNCGRQLPDDSVFCEGCGTPVSRYGAVQQSKQAPKKKGSKSLVMLLVGIIIGVIAIIMITMAFAKLGDSSGNTNSPSAESVKVTAATTSESEQSASKSEASSDSANETTSASANETSSTSADTGSSTSSNADSATQATGKEVHAAVYDLYKNTNNPAYQNAILVLLPDTSQWFYFEGILQKGATTRETVEAIVNNSAYDDAGTYSRKEKNSNVFLFDSKEHEDFYLLYENGANGERLVYCNEKGAYESGVNCVYFDRWYNGDITLT